MRKFNLKKIFQNAQPAPRSIEVDLLPMLTGESITPAQVSTLTARLESLFNQTLASQEVNHKLAAAFCGHLRTLTSVSRRLALRSLNTPKQSQNAFRSPVTVELVAHNFEANNLRNAILDYCQGLESSKPAFVQAYQTFLKAQANINRFIAAT